MIKPEYIRQLPFYHITIDMLKAELAKNDKPIPPYSRVFDANLQNIKALPNFEKIIASDDHANYIVKLKDEEPIMISWADMCCRDVCSPTNK